MVESIRLPHVRTDLHMQAEALFTRFVGKEDAIITSTGFATNSGTLPALVGTVSHLGRTESCVNQIWTDT